VLFLAGIFGERPKSGKEVILATQRALEQQALERWRMQQEAQIEAMMREGLPLGAVAAALASPETAERIALMEAAISGAMSALEAARLNLQRSGQQTTVLDGLAAVDRDGCDTHYVRRELTGGQAVRGSSDQADEGREEGEVALPLAISRHS
jgi:stage V sporulation protein SpoVS